MRHLLSLVYMFCFSILFSQNTKIDSLQQEVNLAKGSEKILQLNELAMEYLNVDSKRSITLGKRALQLSEQYKFYKVKARTLNIISVAYYISNNLAFADKYCDISLEVSKTYGTDLDRMKSLRNKTSFYVNGYRSENLKLRSYLDELLELSRKRNEYELLSDAVNNVIIANTVQKIHQNSIHQNIIKQKDKLIVFVVIAGSFLFAALIIIFILYQIRNKAYKQLVYQSIGVIGNPRFIKNEDNTVEDCGIENKNGNWNEELKRQIEISLNKQLNIKVYLEPSLILKTLAEKCNTNRSYLSQFINEKYNMNFNTFINELRINEAKLILADKSTQIPLKELYLKLGYQSYSVFNDAFKKHVGVTPAFYLKTINNLYDVSNHN